jgi:hypothetical protein
MEAVAVRHRAEPAAGRGLVDLPDALHRQVPEAASSLPRRYLFPASIHGVDPATGA